jgi:iron complex outermembrane receptor protein
MQPVHQTPTTTNYPMKTRFHYTAYLQRCFLIGGLAMSFFSTLLAGAEAEASALVTGRVSVASSGALIEGADVEILGTTLRTTTKRGGIFTFPNVPTGQQTLKVSYTGLDAQNVLIEVVGGRSNSVSVELDSEVTKLDTFIVTGMMEGNAASLARQRSASNVQNTVSIDTYGNVADGNIGNMLQRVPGAAANKEAGDIVGIGLRGMAPEMTSLSVDGTRSASAVAGFSPQGDRAAFIDKIPSEFIKEIVVTKAITPDMAADSLGGDVNLVTKSAFDFKERVLSYTAGATLNTYRRTNPWGPTGAFTFMDALGSQRQIGVSLSGSYTMTTNNRDRVQMTRPSAVDKRVSEARMLDDTYERQRYGYGVKVEYKLTDSLLLKLDTIVNRFEYDLTRVDYRFQSSNNTNLADYSKVSRAAIEAGAVPRSSTNATAGIAPGFTDTFTELLNARYLNQGFVAHQSSHQTKIGVSLEKEWANSSFQIRASHNPTSFTSYSRSFTSRLTGVGIAIDTTDLDRPVFRQTYGTSTAFGTDFSKYLGEFALNPDRTEEEIDGVSADYSRKLELSRLNITFKTGAAFRRQHRDTMTYRQLWDLRGADGVAGLNSATGINDDNIAQFVEARPGYGLFNGLYPSRDVINYGRAEAHFLANPSYYFKRTDNRSAPNEITEDVASAYIMGTAMFEKTTLTAGVRVEETEVSSVGGLSDPARPGTKSFSSTGDYRKYFPGVHFKYEPKYGLIIRSSWTTSIGRPELGDLIPATTVNPLAGVNGRVSTGNPDLDPYYANNWDLGVEYYLTPAGIISINGFRKDISDFIATFTSVVPTGADNGFNGQYAGYDLVTTTNSGDAQVQGIEINYQQQLTMLPKPFNGLGVFGNYTKLKTSGTFLFGSSELALFVPETYNVGGSYNWRGFQFRASYNYKSSFLNTINSGNPALSVYIDNDPTMDLNVSYKFNEKFTVFADYVNIFNKAPSWYTIDRSRTQLAEVYGARLTIGLSGRF